VKFLAKACSLLIFLENAFLKRSQGDILSFIAVSPKSFGIGLGSRILKSTFSRACSWSRPRSSCRTVAPSCWSDSPVRIRADIRGLQDEVDNHWRELLGAAALSTLLALGTEVNSGGRQQQQRRHHSGVKARDRRLAQSDGPTGGPPQSQPPMYVDDPSGIFR
jgi:hypothetical protein